MVFLRHFTEDDIGLLRAARYPDMSEEELRSMLRDWNAGACRGRAFEMFAIFAGETLVGEASLYQHSPQVVSLGVEIREAYRGAGCASEALTMLLEHAKRLGYRIVQDQVRADNAASIRLHEKLGFESDSYVYQNQKGQPVLLFLKAL